VKKIPDPNQPWEVYAYYMDQIKKLVRVWCRDLLRDPFGSGRRTRYRDLIKFSGSGLGRACFVFANGPSIQKLDPARLAKYCSESGADIFCVKYYVNTDFAQVAGADYWVLSDPGDFDTKMEVVRRAFDNARKLVRKAIFVPEERRAAVAAAAGAPALPIIAYNDIETSGAFSRSINPIYPRSYVSMTAYKALAIALYAGYGPIYICGFDNSYVQDFRCDKSNRIYRAVRHFENTATVQAHFTSYSDRTVAHELVALSRLFSDLRKFKDSSIINLDIDSLTDAFKKDDSLPIYRT
jgi:hypothetical protein